jgi:hypothetical protein
MPKRNEHSSYNLAEQASSRRREDNEDDIEIIFEKDVSTTI